MQGNHLGQHGIEQRRAVTTGRQRAGDGNPGPMFQNQEWRAQHCHIFAKRQGPRHDGKMRGERRDHPPFARHVAGPRREHARRRPAQHGGARAEFNAVVAIGDAAGQTGEAGTGPQRQAVQG